MYLVMMPVGRNARCNLNFMTSTRIFGRRYGVAGID